MTTTAIADMGLEELTQSLENNIMRLQQVRNMRADTNATIAERKRVRDRRVDTVVDETERKLHEEDEGVSDRILTHYALERIVDEEQEAYERFVNPLRRQIERMDIVEPQIRQVIEFHNREIARRNGLSF